MFDLEIIETGNGGDLFRKGNDLSIVLGFENFPYLALFGGNKAASTPPAGGRVAGQQNFDYWGNSIFAPNNPAIQFNSLTERMLDSTPLNSAGRLLIEEAIKADLQFMAPFAKITVTTAIIATDAIRIDILVKKPDNLQSTAYSFIWSNTLGELINNGDSTYIPNPVTNPQNGLQYNLQVQL